MTNSQPVSGLLPALIAYYHRLESDPNEPVADYGFTVAKIHAQIVLEPDGSLSAFEDIRNRVQRGKKTTIVPKPLLVPDGGGRPGTGLKPYFCWDNTGYALGRDNKENAARADTKFAAFRDLHLSFRDELADDAGFTALCRFLERWQPAEVESLENWEKLAGLNVVFKIRGRPDYVHQSDRVREAWLSRISKESEDGPTPTGHSLISGEIENLAKTHSMIGGVVGAQSSGAAIVSFNESAFRSYGKSQSYNAPVGVRDAFRYTTALNRLLADNSRRSRIGDATVIFWSDRQSGSEAEETMAAFFADGFKPEDPAEHRATVQRVEKFLEAARQGRLADEIDDPDAPFYILGLSPNASRLNVRYWLTGNVRQFAERLAKHVERLEMVGARPGDPPLVIRRLLLETVRESKEKDKEISPLLAGEVARAVLGGTPYPRALFDAVVRRVRIDAGINHAKAAILKACLLSQEVTVMDSVLNRLHPEPAYHCGRMLALLAFAQEAGLKSVNAGITRRNMGSAMASPGLVLGRLLRAAEVGHIPNLDGNLQLFVRDQLQSVCVALGDRMPVTLDLVKQGIFALGYYQQHNYLNGARAAIKARRLYRSGQGEWMASKLEVRVADALARAKAPYIYESRAILKSGPERWPDFYFHSDPPSDRVYFEVLGGSSSGYGRSPEYDNRWEAKRKAYEAEGITPDGGKAGRLIVLDWRDRWGPEPKTKPIYPSDSDIYSLLSEYVPEIAVAERASPDAKASHS